MSSVTAPALPLASTQKPPPTAVTLAPGTAVPVVRAPLTRIEFRSLLRESSVRDDASPREPKGLASPFAPPVGSSSAPWLASSSQPRSSPSEGHDALDRLAASEDATSPVAARDGDPLDPFARHHASMGPPVSFRQLAFEPGGIPMAQAFAAAPADAPSPRAVASLEDLLPALVRRVAFSGDGRRGTMRLEIGAGRFAGSTLLVHADGGRVRVHVDVPPGVDASGLHGRIAERLQARGIAADAVEVT
jgi:hypothetical protein